MICSSSLPSECYAPSINQDLYLNEASFVMAHDSATGYIHTKNKNKNNGDSYDSNAISDIDEYVAESWGVNDDDMNYNYNNYGQNQGSSTWNKISTNLLAVYGKTQVGSVYEQLNDGARALDLRPRIYNNGTIGFHHGSLINIPLTTITMGGLLEDAKQWCNDNPKELVILFHHELTHEAGYNALSSEVYTEIDDFYATDDDGAVTYDDDNEDEGSNSQSNDQGDDYNDDQQKSGYSYFYSGIAKLKQGYRAHNVPYYPCDVLSGITVGEAMELADLSKLGGKGYLLAVDRHDMYGEHCLHIRLYYIFTQLVIRPSQMSSNVFAHHPYIISQTQPHSVARPTGPKTSSSLVILKMTRTRGRKILDDIKCAQIERTQACPSYLHCKNMCWLARTMMLQTMLTSLVLQQMRVIIHSTKSKGFGKWTLNLQLLASHMLPLHCWMTIEGPTSMQKWCN